MRILLMLWFLMAQSFGQAPNLDAPKRLKLADGSFVDVEGIGHSAPAYGDVDGDQIPDLLVGEFKAGACRVFKNHGGAHKPAFKDFVFLEANGKQAVVPPS